MGGGQQNLGAHSELYSPPMPVCVGFLVGLGLLHALVGEGQILSHCGNHLCSCRGLGAHATSQVQGLAELLPICQGIRRLLGTALQVTIETHVAEE